MEFLSKEGLTYFWSKLKTRFDNLTSATNTNTSEIAVQKARIDSIATLPSGSTTADAELIDIRVKADGTTASSAGNAVREQVSDLKSQTDAMINEADKIFYGHPSLYAGSLDNSDGSEVTRTDNKVWISDFMPVSSMDYISFAATYMGAILYYKSDETWIKTVTRNPGQSMPLAPTSDTAYYRIKLIKSGYPVITELEAVTAFSMYKYNYTKEAIVQLNSDISDVADDLFDTKKYANELTSYVWSHGIFLNGQDVGNTEPQRIKCLTYFFVPAGSIIKTLSDDCWFYACTYSAKSESAFLSGSGWLQSYTITDDTYIRLEIRRDDNQNIAEPFDVLVENVAIQYFTAGNIESVINTSTRLPEYWLTYLDTKIPALQTTVEETALNGDSFVFFTDYHIENNAGFSDEIIKEIISKTAVDKVIFGGDAFNGSSTKAATLAKMREFYARFKPTGMIGIRGNHEYNWNDGGSVAQELTDSDQYAFLLKDHENDYAVSTVPNQLYYTIDNKAQKIRYIMCDARYETDAQSIAQDTEQQTWITNKILELQDGWGVVVMSHQALSPNSDPSVQLQLDNKGWAILSAIRAATVDSNNHAYIIALICGHTHRDSERTYDGFPVICTTCDSMQDQTATRTLGTVTEQAFDVFTIDKTNKKVIITRIGSGSDREYSYV